MENPIRLRIDRLAEQHKMTVSLTPDALGLRTRFKALVVHLHPVPEPILWDLGAEMQLEQVVDCLYAPRKVSITVYGVEPEGGLRLVFRNWGRRQDLLS